MSARLIRWSVVSALAGFLFGFDTVVISGAEQKIQALWGLGAGLHGLAMGAALYGTVLGSLLGGWPTDRLGRRTTLAFIGILYVLSAVGCAFANGVGLLVLARFVGGLGIEAPQQLATLVAIGVAATPSVPGHDRTPVDGILRFID